MAALHRRAQQFRAARDLPAAEQAFRQVLALDPQHPTAAFELGMVLLAAGRFEEGFRLYDTREQRTRRGAFMRGAYAYPEWQGEPLAGQRLLVIGEQGFGDQILMARFLPALGAAAITYAGPPELARLFSPLRVDYLRTTEAKTRPEADFWLFSMSLAARMGATLETLPGAPYLTGHGPPRGGIGVVTKGAAYNANDRYRTLPAEIAAELLALPGAVDLQPEATGAADFQDTADRIAGLDLVISVDTSVAHLAGAMGKPVWVLLSAHGLDWQWMAGRSDSPWYPSARLFRQPAPGDWRSVMDAVRAELG